ncbi:MAG: UDP-N-acetylglucosamine 2-epimerase (non-hydrolyzing) [Saprospiraceae bacterium]|nr:UDP-N-acetylglucosamine 2-epimerase (non-hydrolyzing) [Saprospiraceae bacterium]
MSRIKILIVIGTRPEAIKMAPVVRALQKENDFFELQVCDTGQHLDIKQPILDFFQIQADYQLNALNKSADLTGLTAYLITHFHNVINEFNPDLILVQGDTTSAFASALVGFYLQKKVGHIEAGLRTYHKNSPFPEEFNRQAISRVADLHFAPTTLAKENLIREGIAVDQIYLVGNTVIDALQFALEKIKEKEPDSVKVLKTQLFPFQERYAKMILMTIHRRENLLHHQKELARAIRNILEQEDCFALFPLHPNPAVRNWIQKDLKDLPNLFLIEALPYEAFVWAMEECDLILTDSGGIQEEAPSLGKPVIVLRAQTERPEAQQKGTVREVTIDSKAIQQTVNQLLKTQTIQALIPNPFGDGNAAQKIIASIKQYFFKQLH